MGALGHTGPSKGLDLRDRHVIVTGATRGIGRAIATTLAGRGARLTLVARNADALAELAGAIGGVPVAADLTDLDGLGRVIEHAETANGPVDVLVNNAGVNRPGPLSERSAEQVRTMMLTNLVAPIELMHAVLPGMLERDRGAIVNVSSLAGELSLRNMLPYCSSKGALTMATRALQAELRGTNVFATLVALGAVGDTDMVRDTLKDPFIAIAINRSRRMPIIEPETVAERLADGIESGRQLVVLPGFGVLAHHLRQIPTYSAYGLMYSRRGRDGLTRQTP